MQSELRGDPLGDRRRVRLAVLRRIGRHTLPEPPLDSAGADQCRVPLSPLDPAPPARLDPDGRMVNFAAHPRGRVHVLATLDESTYSGGTMGADHPIAWCHLYRGGRAWYTGGGHTIESYAEPAFRQHLLGGIPWAAGLAPGNCRP